MQPRAEEFLRLLNEIDEHLKQRVRRHEGRGFMMRLDIVARQDTVLQRYRDELREFSELRNAIVHYHDFPARVIAEPTDEVLARLRYVVEQIIDPPKLIPTFAGTVRSLEPGDSLQQAMRLLDEHGFSQLPVFASGKLALLTTDGITRWLAAQGQSQIELAGHTVAEVLPYEKPGSFLIMQDSDTVERARQAFHEALRKGIKLRAVLITGDGEPAAKLLGIVTSSDLLEESGD